MEKRDIRIFRPHWSKELMPTTARTNALINTTLNFRFWLLGLIQTHSVCLRSLLTLFEVRSAVTMSRALGDKCRCHPPHARPAPINTTLNLYLRAFYLPLNSTTVSDGLILKLQLCIVVCYTLVSIYSSLEYIFENIGPTLYNRKANTLFWDLLYF